MNSFIGWIGGKRLLRKEIIAQFPEEKLERYIEVFGGAAWVLLYKDKHATQEIYNDYNSELVNLYRCVKHHCKELQRELQCFLNSRELFFDFLQQYKTRGMTDIQRAARYFMLIKTSYGADLKSFGCVKKNISNATKYLEAIEERLRNVIIENEDFSQLLKTYDKDKSLFYLDPPYYKSEKYYQNVNFTLDDHVRLKDCISKLKSKFILSYNNCNEIKNLYKGYNIIELQRSNNLSKHNSRKYNELLIKNY